MGAGTPRAAGYIPARPRPAASRPSRRRARDGDSVRVLWLMEGEQRELRCGHCNRLLGKGTVVEVSIKCPRCGTMNTIQSVAGDAGKSAEGLSLKAR